MLKVTTSERISKNNEAKIQKENILYLLNECARIKNKIKITSFKISSQKTISNGFKLRTDSKKIDNPKLSEVDLQAEKEKLKGLEETFDTSVSLFENEFSFL